MGVWYRTGTVSVTNGSPNVVGVGTLWLTQASIGDIFLGPNLVEHEITNIIDDTHLTVMQVNGTAAYAGTTASAQLYAIIRNFTSTLPAQLASQLAAMMTAWHVTTDELTAWLSGTGSVTVHDSVGNAYSVQTPAALNSAWNGRLVKNVAGGADVTFTTAEASNLFIELQGTLTANINCNMPAGVRHNFIFNNTAGAFTPTIKTSAGTGVAVAQGRRALLECDGTNVIQALTVANLTGGTIDSTPIGATTPSSGAFTTLSASGTTSLGATNTTALTATGLGVGVSSPVSLVELSAAGTAGSNITGLTLTSANTFTGGAALDTTVSLDFNLHQTAGVNLTFGSIRCGEDTGQGSLRGAIRFFTQLYSAGSVLTERMRIGSNGVVTCNAGLTSTVGITTLGTTITTTVRTSGYTVATLPAGTVGDRAYVTDATAPAFGSALTGGGSVLIPVYRNASGWIAA